MVLLKWRAALALLLVPASLSAAPGGANVTHGNATVTTEGGTTTVTNTPGTIINWERFSVAPDEVTRFVQQNASSAVLNRVTGSQGSQILGQLLSNGRVFLINPNGIAIGAGARIDTAGFVASSLDIADADFLSGRERFAGSGQEGRVVNRGGIDVGAGGNIYLIAPSVENHGVLRAPDGTILLAAGHSAELVSSSSPNLRVRISAPAGGEALNVGELVAKAGRIGLFGAAVNAGGVLDASSASRNARGEVVLSAAGDAIVTAGARVDAGNAVGSGGSVVVEGARVAVLDGALVDASGATGGGDIRVGGDALGVGTSLRNALATVIAPTAVLRADALAQGDGGNVVAWSDEYTGFLGAISARGGAGGGNGGWVETSSAGNLQALGSVDAAAPAGFAGQWLLDPYNITISTAATFNGSFSGGGPNLFTPTGINAVANRDAIQASLNTGTSVTVSTGGVGSPGVQAGTIAVNAPIAKTAGGDATLALNAASTITFAAGATVTSTAGALGLSLTSAGGAITDLRGVDLNGGTLTLHSATASTQATGSVISGDTSVVKEGASAFTLRAGQTYTGTTTINGGTLTLGAANTLPDSTAVMINGGTLNLAGFSDTVGSVGGAGNITLGGGTLTTGGDDASTTLAGVVSGTGGLVKTGSGTLLLTGTNTYTGATTVNGGVLQLGAAERIANGSALVVGAGGTFDLNGYNETVASIAGAGQVLFGNMGALLSTAATATTTFSGVLSGTGGFAKLGGGTLTLSGANTYTGTTTINAGTLTLGASNVLPDSTAVTINAGSLNLAGFSDTVGSVGGAGGIGLGTGTLTTGGDNSSTTLTGSISGAGGSLVKTGTGVFTLGGASTYTGATVVNGGTLRLGAADRIANTSALEVAAGAMFDLNGFSEIVATIAGAGTIQLGVGTAVLATAGGGSTVFSGTLGGSGGFTKGGAGVLTLAGANTYTGATSVTGGTLQLGASERLPDGSAVSLSTGATLALNGFNETIASLAGAGSVTLGSGTLITGGGNTSTTFSGVLSGTGSVTKLGTGTFTLSGVNTFGGSLDVQGGTVALSGTNRLTGGNAVTLAGGTSLTSNSTSQALGSLAGTGNVSLGSGTLTTGSDNSDTTYGGVIAGSGGLIKTGAGTMVLAGANAYTGTTTVNGGVLQLGAAEGIANGSALNVGAGGTFDLNGFNETVASIAGTGQVLFGNMGALLSTAGNATTTFSGVLSGTGSFAKGGTGTLTLSGANTYTGTTTINAGTLTLGASNVLPDSTAVTINAGSLNLAGFSQTVGSVGGAGGIALGSGTLTTGGDDSSTTLAGIISGTNGSLVKVGAGVFTLGGASTYTGATVVNGGTLRLGAANRIANASALEVAAGATFDLDGFSETVATIAGAGAIQLGTGTAVLATAGGGSTVFSGTLDGSGGFTKGGAGVLLLSGTTSHTGATLVTGGTLQLGASERLPDGSAVSVSTGATLALDGYNETIASLAGASGSGVALGGGSLITGGGNTSTTFSGVLSGTGLVTKLGTGTFTLSGVNTFSGALNVLGGTVALTGSNRLTGGNAVVIAGGASLTSNNASQALGSLAGAGNVSLGSGTLTTGSNDTDTIYGGVIAGSGGLVKVGAGTMLLTGANTYTGATTVNGGVLRLGAAERIANGSALNVGADGTFDLNGFNETVASIAGAGQIWLGGLGAQLATIGNASTTYSGVISGIGGLTKAGTGALTLSGSNLYTGATQVNAGTLVAANAMALGDTATGTTVASNATLRISDAAIGNENVTISGNGVSGVGALTGDGTASLAGNVTLAAASRLGTTNASSTLTLGGTVDGAFGLAAVGTGIVVLDGIVGGTTPLASISGGATTPLQLGSGSVTTTGAQAYSGPLALDADTTLRSTGNGAITLANVTGGGFDLTVETGGTTTVNNVTGVDVLATDAPGAVTLNGSVLASTIAIAEAAPNLCGVAGSGDGVVSFAGAVSLCGTTAVNGTDVLFGQTVNSNTGGARALTVNATGTTEFTGLVGATRSLDSLVVEGGTTRFSAGTASQATVRTVGDQTYHTAVQLVGTTGEPRTFTSTAGGNISFNGTVDATGAGSPDLVVRTSGQTLLGGAIGDGAPLNTLTTDAPGTLVITAPSIRTAGAQLYGEPTALVGTTRFTTTGNGNVTFPGAVSSPGLLGFDVGTGDVLLNNPDNELDTVGVTSARNVTLAELDELVLADVTASGTVQVNAGSTLSQAGTILAPTLVAQSGANILLTNAGNDVDTLSLQSGGAASFVDSDEISITALNAVGAASVTAAGALALDGAAQGASLALQSTGSDVTLGSGSTLTATGGGDAIVIDAAARFLNGGATLDPGSGRWVVYSADPALNVFGGLASGQVPVWDATSATLAPALVPAGNRYVFAAGQTLVFTSTDVTKTYGDDASGAVAAAWTVAGFNTDTWGGAFLPDSASLAFSGTPLVTSPGAVVTATVPGSPYVNDIGAGTLAVLNGYTMTFDPAGRLHVDPRALAVAANDATKVYADADPVFTYVATGLINGDVLSGALTRTPGEQVLGSPYAILQGTLANPNYTITFTGADFTITPRPIQVVALPGSKTYGNPDPVLGYNAIGLIGSDTLSGALARTPGETVAGSPYPILRGSLANPNYTIAFTGADFTITRRPAYVVADDLSKTMGAPDPALTYSVSNLVGNDVLGGALVRQPGETLRASPYLILQGSVTDAINPNYTIVYTPGYLSIVPGAVSPYSPVVEVALERAVAAPASLNCLRAPANDGLGSEFEQVQARLDRAAGGVHESRLPPAVCLAQSQ